MSRPGQFLRDQIRRAALGRALQSVGYAVLLVLIGALGMAALDGDAAIASVLVVLMSVYFIVKAAKALGERAKPEDVGVFRDLVQHFKVSLDELSTLVEEERAGLPASATKSFVVLPSWIWNPNGPVLVPIHEIAWIYPKRTTTVSNGDRTTVHELIIRPLYAPNSQISIAAGPSASETVINAVAKHAPWALVGFDQQRNIQWMTSGQKELVDAVSARREQLRS